MYVTKEKLMIEKLKFLLEYFRQIKAELALVKERTVEMRTVSFQRHFVSLKKLKRMFRAKSEETEENKENEPQSILGKPILYLTQFRSAAV